jgi:triosephosphate isomerase (TIM)
MTNKYIYFIANWKMYGDLKSINTLDKVIKFSKSNKNIKFKLIYCPPYTLLSSFSSKFKKTNIDVGAQNCHEHETYGAFTGSVNSKMLKDAGANFIIIGHSENRVQGETNLLINKKIKDALKNKLKIIFCIGETLYEKKNKKTHKILANQILLGLKNIKKISNVIIAYEPVWSIGTGLVPNSSDLLNNINFIKSFIKTRFKYKSPKVVYGGSVNPKNINDLKDINDIDGFLIGGASQDSKKFIDIVKKTFI